MKPYRSFKVTAAAAERLTAIDAEIRIVADERARLAAAIASEGQLAALLQSLQAREARHAELEAERASLRSRKRLELLKRVACAASRWRWQASGVTCSRMTR